MTLLNTFHPQWSAKRERYQSNMKIALQTAPLGESISDGLAVNDEVDSLQKGSIGGE
jgi:hypothetical protein